MNVYFGKIDRAKLYGERNMRLLYIYIDFTQSGKNREGYRGHKQCELNFSTEYIYTMESNSKEKKTIVFNGKRKQNVVKLNRVSGGMRGFTIYRQS